MPATAVPPQIVFNKSNKFMILPPRLPPIIDVHGLPLSASPVEVRVESTEEDCDPLTCALCLTPQYSQTAS